MACAHSKRGAMRAVPTEPSKPPPDRALTRRRGYIQAAKIRIYRWQTVGTSASMRTVTSGALSDIPFINRSWNGVLSFESDVSESIQISFAALPISDRNWRLSHVLASMTTRALCRRAPRLRHGSCDFSVRTERAHSPAQVEGRIRMPRKADQRPDGQRHSKALPESLVVIEAFAGRTKCLHHHDGMRGAEPAGFQDGRRRAVEQLISS